MPALQIVIASLTEVVKELLAKLVIAQEQPLAVMQLVEFVKRPLPVARLVGQPPLFVLLPPAQPAALLMPALQIVIASLTEVVKELLVKLVIVQERPQAVMQLVEFVKHPPPVVRLVGQPLLFVL